MPRHPSRPPSKAIQFHKPDKAPERREATRDGRSKLGTFYHEGWRPLMGFLYAWICLFDFFLAPVAWPILMVWTGQPASQWHPITLQGGGIVHVAFGAIVGVTSYSRGKEKASPWAMMPQINNNISSGDYPQEVADNRAYVDPETRFR